MDECTFDQRDKLRGMKVILHGLTKNGEALNGTRGTVVDMDGSKCNPSLGIYQSIWSDESTFRVYVSLPGRPNPVKVRLANIKLHREIDRSSVGVRLTNEEILTIFRWLANDCEETKKGQGFGDRVDSKARAALVYDWVDGDVVPEVGAIPCCDVTVMGKVDPNSNSLLQILAMSKPICEGNRYVDFAAMSRGLYGDGVSDCALCLEKMKLREEVSLLPCGHQFHPDCINKLHEHRSADPTAPAYVLQPDRIKSVLRPINFPCPTCRKITTGDAKSNLAHYSVNSETRLRNRFLEFIRLGMCCSCQRVFLEESQLASEEVMTPEGPAHSYVGDFGRMPVVTLK